MGREIGRATAIVLAQEGADVAIIARTAHELNETARLIESLGRRAMTQSGDVRKSCDIEQLIQRSLDAFGRIDLYTQQGPELFQHAEVGIDSSVRLHRPELDQQV